jgi:hypothetical protein
MALAIPVSFELWEKTLPRSKMVHPSSLFNQLKYAFWCAYTPLHPFVRDICLTLGVVHHSGRQNFLVGKIASGQSLEDVVNFLLKQGYGNHFVAWKDDGELVSLRKLVGFERQYHLRIFDDGEIRGHFEYTPECYPILHFKAADQRDCQQEFLSLFGGMIVQA